MDRMEKAARTSPSDDSRGKVAMVREEGDEDFCKPLAAHATRKTIPRKDARKRMIIPRRPRRYRPGGISLRERKKWREETNLLIRKTPFIGLYDSIASEIGCGQLHFAKGATKALHEVCEALIVQYFAALDIPAFHAKRVMVMLNHAARLRKLMNLFEPTPNQNSTGN